MRNFVTAAELYEASRETCLRLYVANGGNPEDVWTIKPFPGTAAIARIQLPFHGTRKPRWQWDLHMPAYEAGAKLPRWHSELIGAYTVHELLHALWTDWRVTARASTLGVERLVNAIEDCRIERKAQKSLQKVPEAKRLLEGLTDHIVRRAIAKNCDWSDPKQFAFTLNCVLMLERVGYKTAFPSNWRTLVAPEFLPLFDMAIAEFPALKTTEHVLALALKLKNATPQMQQPKPQEPQDAQSEPQEPQDAQGEAQEPQDAQGEAQEPQDAQSEAQEPQDAQSDDAGEGDQAGKDNQAGEDDNASDQGEAGNATGTAPTDLSDAAQTYDEANLDDLAQAIAKRDGVDAATIERRNQDTQAFYSVQPCALADMLPSYRARIEQVAGLIATPARLRRHVINAVKSPERVGVNRRQATGRFDLRELSALRAGAENVFRRRIEDEGREVAVSLLVDGSSSMTNGNGNGNGVTRQAAAATLALHLGDALKMAATPFEIGAFFVQSKLDLTACIRFAKRFEQPWTDEARQRTAAISRCAEGATLMLPAVRTMANRLLDKPNVTRRILLVLTDGQDFYLPANMVTARAYYGAQGVEIVGIGLCLPVYERPQIVQAFGEDLVFVDDVAQLSEAGFKELAAVLDKRKPALMTRQAA